MINKDNPAEQVDSTKETVQKPNESTGIYVRGFVRITDPESGKVIVETNN
jgi:hypothetical protein